jgi:hypothetical protein
MQKWFVKAHMMIVNSICVLESEKIEAVVITASADNNIHMHLLCNGVMIGQFGQRTLWDIYDINKYFEMKPLKVVARKKKKKKNVGFAIEKDPLSPGEKSSVMGGRSSEKKIVPDEL